MYDYFKMNNILIEHIRDKKMKQFSLSLVFLLIQLIRYFLLHSNAKFHCILVSLQPYHLIVYF